ncbi:MAG: hypothetical protein IH955_00370 [Chloroflexi bacterium]|nr:hypothetical protein [Chloroflexota bacterium]
MKYIHHVVGKTSSMLVLCVVLLSQVIGCGPPLPELPQGTYTTTIASADLANGASSVLSGFWDLTFADDSLFTVFRDGELVVKGTYRVVEDQLTLSDEEGLLACRGGQEIGLYKWALDGDALSLTVIEDQCDGREAILAAHPFSRLP